MLARDSGERLDGRCAIAFLLIVVLVTVLAPPGRWLRLAGEGALVAAALLWLRPSPAWLLRRALLLLPFVLLAIASGAFAHTVPGHLSPSERAAGLAARMLICFAALAAVVRATDTSGLLDALARLRVPAIFISVTALMLRYLGVLEDEAARMMRARDLRGMPPRVRNRAHLAGTMVGTLFVRSVERADRVSLAMQARGFHGLLPPPGPRPVPRRDAWILALFLLAQAIVLVAT